MSLIHLNDIVSVEIFPYKTTDVLGIEERLPFKDGVYGHIVSNAVLEHVRNPIVAA